MTDHFVLTCDQTSYKFKGTYAQVLIILDKLSDLPPNGVYTLSYMINDECVFYACSVYPYVIEKETNTFLCKHHFEVLHENRITCN